MFKPLGQFNYPDSWMKYAFAYTQMSVAASEVILHRSMRMARGAMTAPEAIGMVLEKATAFATATERAAVAAATGADLARIATAALVPISAQTRSNVRKYRS